MSGCLVWGAMVRLGEQCAENGSEILEMCESGHASMRTCWTQTLGKRLESWDDL